MTTMPKKLNTCPIVDAVIEIKFAPKIDFNAVFGVIYKALLPEFSNVESLPIQQIPEAIRNSDPNLKYQPHYKIRSNDIILQIGPCMITVSVSPYYIGWDRFSFKAFNIISKITDLDIISKYERLGLRYINFFKNDLFKDNEKVLVDISLNHTTIPYEKTTLITELTDGTHLCTVKISNDAIINISNIPQKGSIIDIDVFRTEGLNDFVAQKELLINEIHNAEKEMFFKLLSDDLLTSLKPIS